MPRLALAAALALVCAPPARASGPVLGAGAGRVSASSDALLERSEGGFGFHVFGGYRFADRLSFELGVTGLGPKPVTRPTTGISYPEDRAEVSVLDLELRLDLLPSSRHRVVPWVQAGVGVVTLNWQEFFYMQQGIGPSVAAGVDVRVAAGFFVRSAIALARARTNDSYEGRTPDARVTSVLLSAGWQFGWPPLPGPGPGDATPGPRAAPGDGPAAPAP